MRIPTRFPALMPAALLLALAVPPVFSAQTAASARKPATEPKAPAAASRQAPGASPLLAQLDTDHDGKVSRSEWKGNDISFSMLDKNGDGVLTADELAPAAPAVPAPSPEVARARQEKIFRWMDANHDGRVTKAEWRGDAAKFAHLDRNHDGVVTLEEYLQK
jgi:hypothetical protein